MLTLRQIEKLWNAKAFGRLLDELCAGRAEGVNGIRELLDLPAGETAATGGRSVAESQSIAAAAMTIIRADELRQSAHPHVGKMIRLLLTRQNDQGGWSNSILTALAARGLAGGSTASAAVDNALLYLADRQTSDGEWPVSDSRDDCVPPHGRADFDEDAGLTGMAVTAFVLYQLATIRRPAAALLIDSALNQMLTPVAADRQVDTQLATLRRRIEARRVLAPAA